MTDRALSLKTTRIPGVGIFHLPLTRNDLLLILVAVNQFAIGVESYLAHMISGGVKPAESIPVYFGPFAAIILLMALYLRIFRKMTTASTLIIIGIASLSVVVGIFGLMFHSERALAPEYLPGSRLQWDWLIHAPPALAPLAFAGIGLMAIIAALEDTKPESGQLTLPGVLTFKTPLTQTQQLLWLVALGLFAATVSAFIDHSRTNFEDIFVWIPEILGLFASVVTITLALYKRPTASDYFIFFWTMMLMILVGVMGMALHINVDLPEGGEGIVLERFIRGAPPMAPMLFANMGLLGIITMVGADTSDDPELTSSEKSTATEPRIEPEATTEISH